MRDFRSSALWGVGGMVVLRSAQAIAILGCLTFSATFGQEFRAILTGTVTDQQGAVMPKVKIEVKNSATNVTNTAETTEKGSYSLPTLNPGVYTVTVSAVGFKARVEKDVELRVNDRRQLDFSLEIGASTETVTITAEAPLIDLASGSGGTTINADLVAALPLLGSNPYSLINMTSGNSHLSAFPDHLSERPFDNGGMDGYSINGGPAGGNNNSFLIDGAPNNNNEGLGFVPSPAAVGEIKVLTNVYDAEYGKGAGITSVSLRTGTNSLHGQLFWNIRNNHLNANLTQLTARGQAAAAYHWSEPVASVQGPILIPHLYDGRNRTFFSYTFRYLYDAFPNPVNRVYPTKLERVGNFSQTIGTNGQPIAIYDPTSSATGTNRAAFVGGIIPSNRIECHGDHSSPYTRNLTNWQLR